jgi:hypothetical protein
MHPSQSATGHAGHLFHSTPLSSPLTPPACAPVLTSRCKTGQLGVRHGSRRGAKRPINSLGIPANFLIPKDLTRRSEPKITLRKPEWRWQRYPKTRHPIFGRIHAVSHPLFALHPATGKFRTTHSHFIPPVLLIRSTTQGINGLPNCPRSFCGFHPHGLHRCGW